MIKQLTGHTYISKIEKDYALIHKILSQANEGIKIEHKSIYDILGNLMEIRSEVLNNLNSLLGEEVVSEIGVIIL